METGLLIWLIGEKKIDKAICNLQMIFACEHMRL